VPGAIDAAAALGAATDQLSAATGQLAAATQQLTAATDYIRSPRSRGKTLTFHLDVWAPGDVTHTPRGVLKYIHNPNAAPVTLRLLDLMSRRILWAGTLAAGDQAGVYAPFAAGIDCTVLALPAGSDPIILAGDYDANE
jgi:hypothetical protein